MTPDHTGPVRESFPQIGEQQLEIFATELKRLFRESQRLREEIEGWQLRLEKRMHELQALNQMLSRHPDRQLSADEVMQTVTARLEETGNEVRTLTRFLSRLRSMREYVRPGPGDPHRRFPRSTGRSRGGSPTT